MSEGSNILVELGWPEPDWFPCSRCGKDCDARGRRKNVTCFYCNRELEAREHSHELKRRMALSLPTRFRDAMFTNPEAVARISATAPQFEAAKRAAIAGREAVVLSGPSRAGKTTLGACMLDHATRNNIFGVFLPARALIGFELRDEWMHSTVILIDDVGNEREQKNCLLPDLVAERHDRKLATWATTGLTQDEVRDRYGEGIARRFYERALVIQLEGPR